MRATRLGCASLGWALVLLAAACSNSDETQVTLVPCTSVTINESYLRDGSLDDGGLLCLPRSLSLNADGLVSCAVLEARYSDSGCDCNLPGRGQLSPDRQALVADALALPLQPAANCVCELNQLTAEDEQIACRNDPSEPLVVAGEPVEGWCMVDATMIPPLGNPELVAACGEVNRRGLRLLGEPPAGPQSGLLIVCTEGAFCPAPE